MSDPAFKALADPTRREILRMLSERERTVNEIVERFEISQPAISRHLSLLKSAGLVTSVRRGQNIVYTLDTTVFQDLVRALLDLAPATARRRGPVRRST
jgi:ArsR family transcriptional regulator, arsenate/arsenite/antimonite-responsive transcriptional repressor